MDRNSENEDFPEVVSEIEDDNEALMNSVLAEFDKTDENVTLQIKVYRVAGGQNVKGQREKFLFYVDPSELPILERVRDEYGSGVYRVRIYKTIGNKTGLVRSFDFDIEAAPIKTTPTQSSSDMSVVLNAIEKQNQTMMQFMQRVFERPQIPVAPISDPMDQFVKMATVFSTLMSNKADTAAPVESMISVLTKGIELGEKMSGGGSEKIGGMELLNTALKGGLIEKLISQQPTPQGVVGGAHLQPRQPIPQNIQPRETPKPIAQPETPPDVNLQVQLLAHIVNQLGDFAKRNAEVSSAADWVFDNVPPVMVNAMLQDGQVLDRLAANFPVVVSHRGWFTALLQELRTALTEDQTLERSGALDHTGRDGGGARDHESHAPPSPESET